MKLGQKVRGSAVLEAVFSWPQDTWAVKQRNYRRSEREFVGYIVGVRSLREGTTYNEFEDGYVFEPKKYIRAYLVAVSLREMVHALPEDVEVVEQ